MKKWILLVAALFFVSIQKGMYDLTEYRTIKEDMQSVLQKIDCITDGIGLQTVLPIRNGIMESMHREFTDMMQLQKTKEYIQITVPKLKFLADYVVNMFVYEIPSVFHTISS